MSRKNSLAQKKRWSKISKKKRSQIMGDLSRARHASMSDAERRMEGMRLVKARKKKMKGV